MKPLVPLHIYIYIYIYCSLIKSVGKIVPFLLAIKDRCNSLVDEIRTYVFASEIQSVTRVYINPL